jgi:hypothetical protein
MPANSRWDLIQVLKGQTYKKFVKIFSDKYILKSKNIMHIDCVSENGQHFTCISVSNKQLL